ncbi:Iron reductase [Sphingomonas antarctica]|uniref:hypothetical protein n=1 Tax=Sphingomonas antarctica TaxID=2040274 RepID=UPI0039EC05B4
MPTRATQTGRVRVRAGEGHQGYLTKALWAKVAGTICLIALMLYIADPAPHSSGGTAFGYISGTASAGLILWLTALGVRKRAMTRGRWSLKGWTSAHVWLGLSLIVVVTLHTAFDFGWNLHTLAYALMMVVILSGLFGVTMYQTIPSRMSANRGETTEAQMLEALRAIDRQLDAAAQPLDHETAAWVLASIDEDPFAGSFVNRLSGQYPRCRTEAAQAAIRRLTGSRADMGDDPLERVDALLEKKQALLARMRRHMRLKALLEIWLYVHVPLTFATIAAVAAHVVAVFFFW